MKPSPQNILIINLILSLMEVYYDRKSKGTT